MLTLPQQCSFFLSIPTESGRAVSCGRIGFPGSGPSGRAPEAVASGVDLRADAEVEADRLEQQERRAGGVDVSRGELAGVLLDDRRGRVVALRLLVVLDRGPGIVAVL